MKKRPYTTDCQYKNVLQEILEHGTRAESQQGTDALTLMVPTPMHFKLSNGFPMITERDIRRFWKQAIGEIFAFINGARTLTDLEKFGCYWWRPWGTKKKCEKRGLKTGDLGPGSYGAAFFDFPSVYGTNFNQFQHLIEQMEELPHLRTHFISPWIPQYIGRGRTKQQKVIVAPCHGWIHVRIMDNKLTLVMFQRSADVPVGVPANMVQYAALTLALAQVIKCEPYKYIHIMSDAHIYVDQIPYVEEMLSRNSRPFPSVKIDSSISNIFEFRKEHFELMPDYMPHPAIKDIPVAI